jgi:hypothetical protein
MMGKGKIDMPTKATLSTLLFALTLLAPAILTSPSSVEAQKASRITGTYTNMHYVAEAGDVIGYEIKIVFTGDRFQAALQIAEGVPGELVVVDVQSDNANITFSIPDRYSYAGQFRGTIENGVLKGEFLFKNGGSEKVELRRGKSYWD